MLLVHVYIFFAFILSCCLRYVLFHILCPASHPLFHHKYISNNKLVALLESSPYILFIVLNQRMTSRTVVAYILDDTWGMRRFSVNTGIIINETKKTNACWCSALVIYLHISPPRVASSRLLNTLTLQLKYSNIGLGLWCLTPLTTIFLLYRGGQFYWIGETRENHLPVASHWQTSHDVVSCTPRHERDSNSQL